MRDERNSHQALSSALTIMWHGRWGRYKTIKGEVHKLCNGPLHGEDGEFMPLRSFWTFKSGPRAGKPMSRCIACERLYRGRNIESGLVPVDRVWFVFQELQFRIGKTETCRRLGISINFWMRAERRIYTNMYRKTAKAAMILLRELREQNIARHKDSIRHGAAQRGRKERTPIGERDFNGKNETANEYRRNYRRKAS